MGNIASHIHPIWKCVSMFPSLSPLTCTKSQLTPACLNLHEKSFENVHIMSSIISSMPDAGSSKTVTQYYNIIYIFVLICVWDI